MKQFRTMLLGSVAMRACVAAILTVLYIGGYALGAKIESSPPNDCYDRAKIICQTLNQNAVWIDVPVKALGFGM